MASRLLIIKEGDDILYQHQLIKIPNTSLVSTSLPSLSRVKWLAISYMYTHPAISIIVNSAE